MLLTFGKKIGSIDLKVLKTLGKIVLFSRKMRLCSLLYQIEAQVVLNPEKI